MHPFHHLGLNLTRRYFFGAGLHAVGMGALATLLSDSQARGADAGVAPSGPHHKAKATNVIYLHMVGGPPQMDLYDYKPKMVAEYDKPLPESIRKGQRLTTMTSGQARFPVAPSKFKFAKHGQSGM